MEGDMGINRASNAASYMSLLAPGKQTGNGAGTDFTSLLTQALGQYQGINTGPSENTGSHSSPSHTYSQESVQALNRRTDPEYTSFWENATSKESITLPEEYIQYRTDGTKVITNEGMEYLAKTRVENALPLAPPSLNDARNRYADSYQHLENSFTNLINNSGYDVSIRLNATDPLSYFYGTFYCLDNDSDQASFSRYLRNSDDYKTINGLAEETAFYGAIVSLAENNAEFKNAYEMDSISALRDYASSIVEEMSSIQLPETKGGRGGFASASQRGYFTRNGTGNAFAPGLTLAP